MPESQERPTIRPAAASDAKPMADIYNHYVTESIITFEEEPVTPEEIARRMEQVQSASLPWLVAEEDGEVTGYAYAALWKTRTAYRFSVEATVYLAPGRARRGIGSALFNSLLPLLQARGVHAIVGGIALPNEASVALCEKFGLRKVAHFPEVGFKFNRWIDVGYWQRTL
jgi:L-amino acid N-acyltransferase YncA